jgi:hypothetical protein
MTSGLSAMGGSLRAAGTGSAAVLALGAIGGLLMIVSLFATVISVDVATGSCEVINESNPELAEGCELSGFERHSVAFLLLGLLAVLMAWGASVGRSVPAGAALIGIGLIALAFAVLSDLPASDDTGALGRNFEAASASAGAGLYLEILSGLLVILAGALRLGSRAARAEREQLRRSAPR